MSQLDRALQREIMALAIEAYPAYIGHKFGRVPDSYEAINNTLMDPLLVNIHYLHEHKLINFDLDGYKLMGSTALNWVKATAYGIDFMQQDGGLSAILNVTTVKFHRDAVMVLEDLIAMSNLSDIEKVKAKSALTEMSTEALKSVVQGLTTASLALLIK